MYRNVRLKNTRPPLRTVQGSYASWVSLLIPFVVAYIAYAWHAMDKKKITQTEITGEGDKYRGVIA